MSLEGTSDCVYKQHIGCAMPIASSEQRKYFYNTLFCIQSPFSRIRVKAPGSRSLLIPPLMSIRQLRSQEHKVLSFAKGVLASFDQPFSMGQIQRLYLHCTHMRRNQNRSDGLYGSIHAKVL